MEMPLFTGDYAFAEVVDPATYWDPPVCEVCGAQVGQPLWHGTRALTLRPGNRWKTPGDVIMGGGFWPFVVSRRFFEIWGAEDLQGVGEWQPVQVQGAGDPDYLLPILPPPHIRADLSLMNMRWMRQPTCFYCESGTVLGYDRLVVCATSWDGSDLFELVNRPGEVIVSPRLAEWAGAHEITNFSLVAADERAVDHTLSWKKQSTA
jgi:hypothetical protein